MRLISIFIFVVTLTFASNDTIEINFKDLKIEDFIKMVSKITGKNILQSVVIPGKVNFISVKPIKKSEIYDLLINILKNRGYTLVDTGSGYLQIVRSSDARRESPPINVYNGLNQIQTQIIHIKNIPVSQMISQINFLLSKYGSMTISKETNSLIVTDYPKNIMSIKSLLKRLDAQKKMRIVFYKLKNSQASKLLPKLKKIATTLYDQNIPSQKIILFSNESTNSIIVVSRANIIENILKYIKKLDKKEISTKQTLHIVHLKNSDATAMVKTLNDIISHHSLAKDKKAIKSGKNPSFTADKETNILMIYASNEQFDEIKKLIDALDIPRQQVYVVAKIVEISDKKSRQIGAKYGMMGGMSTSEGLLTFSNNLGGPPVAIDLQGLGISVPNVKRAVALGATISLLELNNAADTLSEPSLLCVNNVESSIYVGETQSIITQGTIPKNTTSIQSNSYTREDIGLTLKVKPRISSNDKVSMDVRVTIEGVKETLQIGLPVTTKRDISTTAIVENGESIIIGGLTQKLIKDNKQKVPVLGDIPILGNLFRYSDGSNDKKSLVIILTPYIVDKAKGLSSLKRTLAKLNRLENIFVQKLEKRLDKR